MGILLPRLEVASVWLPDVPTERTLARTKGMVRGLLRRRPRPGEVPPAPPGLRQALISELEHDPEKCVAVFPRDKRGTRLRGDHAQTRT